VYGRTTAWMRISDWSYSSIHAYQTEECDVSGYLQCNSGNFLRYVNFAANYFYYMYYVYISFVGETSLWIVCWIAWNKQKSKCSSYTSITFLPIIATHSCRCCREEPWMAVCQTII
jgi:hypothetical protein